MAHISRPRSMRAAAMVDVVVAARSRRHVRQDAPPAPPWAAERAHRVNARVLRMAIWCVQGQNQPLVSR